MTREEKQRRIEGVEAAESNLRDVIARAVPRGPRRQRAIDKARHARSIAVKAISEIRE